jgi:hypothetical protein
MGKEKRREKKYYKTRNSDRVLRINLHKKLDDDDDDDGERVGSDKQQMFHIETVKLCCE